MVPFAITNTANCQVIAYDASRLARILCCACIVTKYLHKFAELWWIQCYQIWQFVVNLAIFYVESAAEVCVQFFFKQIFGHQKNWKHNLRFGLKIEVKAGRFYCMKTVKYNFIETSSIWRHVLKLNLCSNDIYAIVLWLENNN